MPTFDSDQDEILKKPIFDAINPRYYAAANGVIVNFYKRNEYFETLVKPFVADGWKRCGLVEYGPALGKLKAFEPHSASFVNEDKGIGAIVEASGTGFSVTVFSASELSSDDMLEVMDAVSKATKIKPPRIRKEGDDKIGIGFSRWNKDLGVSYTTRAVAVPSLDDIAANYDADTLNAIRALAARKKDATTGKLVLWHGMPGTGKTWAIRALLREMYSEFYPIVVSDPESLCNEVEYYRRLVDALQHAETGPMFIMEDSSALLSRENKTANLTMINRLLNYTDGILGQGDNALFVITFNERLEAIDSAFTRAGRCCSLIEFKPLDPKAATRWLSDRNIKQEVVVPTSLADLYAIKAEAPVTTEVS